MGIADTLLNVMALVQTGLSLKSIVDEAQAKKAAGATDEEIHKWLKESANKAVNELGNKLRGNT